MKETRMTRRVLCGLVLLLVFTLVGNAAAQQTCTPPPPGLVSWWPGNGNANDIADSNNGTLQGGVSFGAGKVGQGFNFNGTNGVVAVPDTPTLDITGDITIDAWINPAVIAGDQRVIASKRSFNNNDANIIFFLEQNGSLAFASKFGGGPFAQVNSVTTIPLNQFTHVAVTIQETTLSFYINGQLDQTFSYPFTRPANDGRFTIGLLEVDPISFPPTGQFAPFNGVIDELEVFSHALTASEILAIFTAESAGKCINCVPVPSGLVSWWPGDDNANDIADANNGTPQGHATFAAGLVGQAFSFDGNGDFISIPDSASLDITQAIALDAWIKANSFELPPGPDTGDANIYVISKDTDTGRNYGIGVTDVDLPPTSGCGPGGAHAFMIAFTSGGIALACGSTPLSTGVFHHLAGTYDSSTGEAKIYVNGVLDGMASVTPGSTINSGPADVQIGARQYPGFRAFFNGVIDEVQIFNRALSAGEVQEIVHADRAGKCKVITVAIDIKPGSFPNSINPKSKGKIPVAILSSATFNAVTQVDQATLTFGHSGNEPSLAFCNPNGEDVNGDTLLDLVCHFHTPTAYFQSGDTQGILKGKTVGNIPIMGTDSVRIVPPE